MASIGKQSPAMLGASKAASALVAPEAALCASACSFLEEQALL